MSFSELTLYTPKFTKEWQEFKLYDLAIWKNGRAFKSKDFSKEGVPIIKIAELKNGITSQTKYTKDSFDDIYALKSNDMLFSWSGSPETSIDIFKYQLDNGWLNQHIFKVISNKQIDQEYLFYLIKYLKPNFIAIAKNKQTTGLGHVTVTDLKKITVKIPFIEEQIEISKILSEIDQKIETNNKINKKLEEMAQAIFKQWFVDFEFPNEDGKPYKSSGGEMVESELGMIPKGWRVKLLKDYCDVKKGLSYKGKHLVEDGVPMINLGNVNPGGGFRSDKCKFYDGDFKEQHTVKAGDIIIANTDMTQDRVILGSPILVPDFKTESIIFTHHLFAFRNLKIPKSFLYYYLKSKSFRERAESYATGTTVLAISRDSVLNINFVKANNEVLNKFDLITKSILDRIKNNNLEIEKLQKLRDTLLPKLMSGEIRVPIN